MIHFAVCYDFGRGWSACVMTFRNEAHANTVLGHSDPKRIGYVGCADFQEAVTRASMMERNERNAWGVIQ